MGGSTAPKVTSAQVPARKTTKRRKNQRNGKVNFRYVACISILAVLSVAMCLIYLTLQTSYVSLQKRETALSSQLSAMIRENDANENRVLSSVNLEEIRDRAMNDLGMVYASQDQIVTYQSPGSDYVKQYQDIPKD